MSGKEDTKTVRLSERILTDIQALRVGDETQKSLVERLLQEACHTQTGNTQVNSKNSEIPSFDNISLTLLRVQEMCKLLILSRAGNDPALMELVEWTRREN